MVLLCLFVSSPDCLYSHHSERVGWCKAKYFSSNTLHAPFRLVCHLLSPLTEAITGIHLFFIVWENTGGLSWSPSLDLNLLDQSGSAMFAVRGSSRSRSLYVINMLIFAADAGTLVFKQCTTFNI